MVSPDIRMGDAVPITVVYDDPPFVEYLYDVIIPPPLLVGAVNATDNCCEPETVTPVMVGASGTKHGVADTATEDGEFPIAFVARITIGYDVPFVSPVISNVVLVFPFETNMVPLFVE